MSDGEKAPFKVRKTELCEVCDKYFTKKGIHLHKQKYHRPEVERKKKGRTMKEGKKPALKKMFNCVYCQKKFSHMASMKVNLKFNIGI